MGEYDSPSTGFETRMRNSRPAGSDSRSMSGGWYNNGLTPSRDHQVGRLSFLQEEQERDRLDKNWRGNICDWF